MLHLKVWLHKTLTLYRATKKKSMSCCVSEFVGMFIFLYCEDEMTYCCCPVPSHLAHIYINIISSQATSVYLPLACISNASPVNPRKESLMT